MEVQKPYYCKRIFMFYYGLYYDETLLYHGGFIKIKLLKKAMNDAFNNGLFSAFSLSDKEFVSTFVNGIVIYLNPKSCNKLAIPISINLSLSNPSFIPVKIAIEQTLKECSYISALLSLIS